MSTKTLGAIALALTAAASASAVSPLTPFTLTTTSYGQDFNTLSNSASPSQLLPAGWQIDEVGSSTTVAGDDAYNVGTGSVNTGTAYSFGAAGSPDRALGSLSSGSSSPIYLGAIFTNGLGAAITSLSLSYFGEQWRLSNGAGDALTFEYSTNATSIAPGSGTWTALSALDFAAILSNGTSGGAALDGNLAANRKSISGVISGLSIANGGTFGIRWTDVDVTNGDQGLAIDDLSFTATTAQAAVVPEPASWAMMVAGFGLLGGAMRRRRPVAFA